MVAARQVAEIMGGRQVFRHGIGSIRELNAAVCRGLPKSALRNTVRHVFKDPSDQRRLLHRIVPEGTLKRRRDRLSSAESERTERLARVIAMTEYVWGGAEDARRFLTGEHPLLGGKTPIEVAGTELGAREVEDLLARIFYGIPA